MKTFPKNITVPFIACLLAVSLFSCTKSGPSDAGEDDVCDKIKNLKIKPISPIIKGGDFTLDADDIDLVNYEWFGPGNFTSYYADNSFTNAGYDKMGWYYLNVYTSDCETKHDSVYVEVKFPQGTPGCSVANNHINFGNTGFPDQAFPSGIYFDGSLGGFNYIGNGPDGDFYIVFSSYWLSAPGQKLSDGIYTTTNEISLEYADMDQVRIYTNNMGVTWNAEAYKSVYISHVGGKLQIAFCDINFTGVYGSSVYTGAVSAKITEE